MYVVSIFIVGVGEGQGLHIAPPAKAWLVGEEKDLRGSAIYLSCKSLSVNIIRYVMCMNYHLRCNPSPSSVYNIGRPQDTVIRGT